jgi:dGTPase
VPLVGPVFEEVGRRYPGLDDGRLIHEAIRRVIDLMVRDLISETERRLAAGGVESADAVRSLGTPVAAFSDEMRDHDRALKRFLFERMYRHPRVNRMASKARRVVRELFQLLLAEPGCLPCEWAVPSGASEAERARLVADYLAGMTDRFALDEHRRLFDTYAPV